LNSNLFEFKWNCLNSLSVEEKRKEEGKEREPSSSVAQNPSPPLGHLFPPPLLFSFRVGRAPAQFPLIPVPLSSLSFPSAQHALTRSPLLPRPSVLFSFPPLPGWPHRSDAPSSPRPIPPPLFLPRRPAARPLAVDPSRSASGPPFPSHTPDPSPTWTLLEAWPRSDVGEPNGRGRYGIRCQCPARQGRFTPLFLSRVRSLVLSPSRYCPSQPSPCPGAHRIWARTVAASEPPPSNCRPPVPLRPC
jgi:hypothetical protein